MRMCACDLQSDTVLRALRFLDTLLQRDDMQKAAFLKDLAQLWPRCDGRVLRYRVWSSLLPASCISCWSSTADINIAYPKNPV